VRIFNLVGALVLGALVWWAALQDPIAAVLGATAALTLFSCVIVFVSSEDEGEE
jgi:hypothetical protein